MNILDAIVEHKKMEVLKRKARRPLSDLRSFPHYGGDTNRVDPGPGPGVIAEFKRKSPSRGTINSHASAVGVAEGYRKAGARAMSILTDRDFFGGSLRDLLAVRESEPDLPLLRKDFIIDPFQVHEASAYGADIILLIAAILDPVQVKELAMAAAELDLQVLFEVHNEEELEKIQPSITFVGVNNRDLKTFKVDTNKSLELLPKMPGRVVPVSESGLGDPGEVRRLYNAGFSLFLMGEAFMKEADPGSACRTFIENTRI